MTSRAPGSEEIHLDLFGTTVVIRCDDSRWVPLLRQLWEPFVVADAHEAITLLVRQKDDGWEASARGQSRTAGKPWLFAYEVRQLLTEIATDGLHHLVALHAAVVARGDGALLLAGATGVGKTTLALAFVERGWKLFSDDLAPIDSGGSVLPFPKPLAVRDVKRWTPLSRLWSPPEWPPRPRDPFLVPASAFGPPPVTPIRPAALAFPHFKPDAGAEIRRISGAKALLQAGECTRSLTPENLAVLGKLCASVPAFQLTYGSGEEGMALLSRTLVAEFHILD